MKKYFLLYFICFSSFLLALDFSNCLESQLSSARSLKQAVFADIDDQTDLTALQDIYSKMRVLAEPHPVRSIEAKRLINQEDWKRFSSSMKGRTWESYGEDTMKAWFKGREYVLALPPDKKIDSQLLKDIHKITTENHKFHGFEGRRILKRRKDGEISQEEFKSLLNKAYKNDEEIAGVSHSSLRGLYRHDPIDQVIHRGSSFNSDGSRYFTKNELEELRRNKYINVDESTIKQTGKNSYTGTAYFMDVNKVEESVEQILQNTENQLKKAKNLSQVLTTVVTMSKDLISVHPFLDGNGRTIRFLGDYILSRYNLPPSLYPNESDLTMSLESAVDFHLTGMRDYLREHQNFRMTQMNLRNGD